MAKNPEYREKVLKEVKNNIKDTNNIQFEELKNLDFLTALIKECLRYYPLTPTLVPRIATKDHTIGDLVIRKGDGINVGILNVHYDEKYYK
jgi:cytochrome P450